MCELGKGEWFHLILWWFQSRSKSEQGMFYVVVNLLDKARLYCRSISTILALRIPWFQLQIWHTNRDGAIQLKVRLACNRSITFPEQSQKGDCALSKLKPMSHYVFQAFLCKKYELMFVEAEASKQHPSDCGKQASSSSFDTTTAHTFCASPDTRISYRQCLLIQGYFCAV